MGWKALGIGVRQGVWIQLGQVVFKSVSHISIRLTEVKWFWLELARVVVRPKELAATHSLSASLELAWKAVTSLCACLMLELARMVVRPRVLAVQQAQRCLPAGRATACRQPRGSGD